MNEYNSYLRVVLTDYSGETQKNALYVLDDAMQVCGNIGDLAEGEDIRSARFLGDIGYFVTFRNTDPLFSVDLSDPSDPKILGELKITGFSSYLHFYGENKLLGVGNEVDPETGAYTGIKLAMFDVSDPSNVKQLHKFVIKDTYDCPLFYNYKAAMIDTEKMFLASCVIPAIWSFAMMKKKDLKMSSRKISEILTMATLTTDFRKSGAVLSAIIFIWSAADRSVFMTWQTITKKSEDWNFKICR